MPRRRGRGSSSTANPSVVRRNRYSVRDFDDNWLHRYAERQYSNFVDLTQYEDRRRWHPSKLRFHPMGPAPQGLQTRPRIVIVPEGHSLARLAPYGGRVLLPKLLRKEKRIRRRSLDYPTEQKLRDKYFRPYSAYVGDHLSRRVGFQHPWQVIICIRRQRRREVIFALGRGGKGGKRRRKVHRNFYSEVRC